MKSLLVFIVFFSVLLMSVCFPRANATVTSGTIHILSNGTVDSLAIVRNGDMYTLVDDVNITSHVDGIQIERDNIVLNGTGHTVMGIGDDDDGIHVIGRNNVTIMDITVRNFYWGFYLDSSTNCTVFECNMTANDWFGIRIDQGGDNSISNSTITENINNGVDAAYSAGNRIFGNTISYDEDGVFFTSGFNNTVAYNLIYHNDVGVYLWDGTNHTTVFGNNITQNGWGVALYNATENSIAGNEITDGENGLYIEVSSGNTIYHNNFMNNTSGHVYNFESSNTWDNGYPSGGNYWSNYTGTDGNGDGIGDTPHVLDANNQDRYPLTTRYTLLELPSIMIYTALALVTLVITCACKQKPKQKPHLPSAS